MKNFRGRRGLLGSLIMYTGKTSVVLLNKNKKQLSRIVRIVETFSSLLKIYKNHESFLHQNYILSKCNFTQSAAIIGFAKCPIHIIRLKVLSM